MNAWGLYEGMQFTCNEAGDFLTELFQYLLHRSGRKGWSAELGYSEDYCRLRDMMYLTHSVYRNEWFIRSEIDYNEDGPFDELQRLSRVNVYFNQRGGDRVESYFVYLISLDTLDGCYYFCLLQLITRCRSVGECLALVDAVASDLDSVIEIGVKDQQDRELVYYLQNKCVPFETDPVRLAAIQRKIQILDRDAEAVSKVLGPLHI